MPSEIYCDAVLLDMDGTLVDSTECVVRQWSLWSERHGIDVNTVLEVSHGRPTLETMRLVAPHLATTEEARRMEGEEIADQDCGQPVRGASAFVSALPSDRWAVVTSAPKRLARVRLSRAGLPVPSVLVSVEDVRKGKPDPESYLLAARLLGVPPGRCLVFEDAPAGIQAARQAGMPVVGITTTFSPDQLGNLLCFEDFASVSVAVAEAAGGGGVLRISVT